MSFPLTSNPRVSRMLCLGWCYLQGFAFLAKYRTLRGGDEKMVDEVDYNFGRAFQQLGLHTYAVTHYEKVLQATEERLGQGSQVSDLDYIHFKFTGRLYVLCSFRIMGLLG